MRPTQSLYIEAKSQKSAIASNILHLRVQVQASQIKNITNQTSPNSTGTEVQSLCFHTQHVQTRFKAPDGSAHKTAGPEIYLLICNICCRLGGIGARHVILDLLAQIVQQIERVKIIGLQFLDTLCLRTLPFFVGSGFQKKKIKMQDSNMMFTSLLKWPFAV